MELSKAYMRITSVIRCVVGFGVALALSFACHDEEGGGEQAGQTCDVPDECYPDVDDLDALRGDVICLDRVAGGYCTHLCTTDEDCCAVEGECRTGYPQVCAPYESTGMMMCFLSCEADDLGGDDPDAYCYDNASREFTCRSTGGGSENRKVCA